MHKEHRPPLSHVVIGLRSLESEAHEVEFRRLIVGQEHLEDVETEVDGGLVEPRQPLEGSARDEELFVARDRLDRASVFQTGAGLHLGEY